MADGAAVLVEGGVGHQSARVTIASARVLAAAGVPSLVLTWNPSSLASASRAVARVVPVDDGAGASAWLTDAAPEGVLATSDAAALGTGLPGADLVDKRALHERARERDVPIPPSEIVEGARALRAAADGLHYPIVCKPVIGKPAAVIRTPAAIEPFLARVGAHAAIVVQPLLPGRVRAVAGVVRDGRIAALVHQVTLRSWPAPAGTTAAAVTTDPDPELEARATALVEGYEGVFHVQFLDGLLLDCNLRPYGTIGLAAAAGANLLALWGANGILTGPPARGRAGVRYRWIEGDVRFAAARIRRSPYDAMRVLAEHRPRLGTAHGDVATLTDPGPALARIRLRVAGSRGRPA